MWAPVLNALQRRVAVQLTLTPVTKCGRACRMYSSDTKKADQLKHQKNNEEEVKDKKKKKNDEEDDKKKKKNDEEDTKDKKKEKKKKSEESTTKIVRSGEVVYRRAVRTESGKRLSAVQRHKFQNILTTLHNNKEKPVSIYMDSDTNSGINVWPARWMKRGWKTMIDTEVCNKDIITEIIYELAARKHPVKWTAMPYEDYFKVDENDLQDDRAEIKVGNAVDYDMPALVPEPGFYEVYATELREMEKQEEKERALHQKRDEETGIIPKVVAEEGGEVVVKEVKEKKTMKAKIGNKKVKVKVTKEKKKVVVKSKKHAGKSTKKGDKGKESKKQKM